MDANSDLLGPFTTPTMGITTTHFTTDQSRRVEALRIAKDLLAGRPGFNGARANPDRLDMEWLANYIVEGRDWEGRDAQIEANVHLVSDAAWGPEDYGKDGDALPRSQR